MTPDTRALYLRVSRMLFDDALTCGAYTLVYSDDYGGRCEAIYTLYRDGVFVRRWRVKSRGALPTARAAIAQTLARLGTWQRIEWGGWELADELGAPPRPVPVVTIEFAPRQQLTLWGNAAA